MTERNIPNRPSGSHGNQEHGNQREGNPNQGGDQAQERARDEQGRFTDEPEGSSNPGDRGSNSASRSGSKSGSRETEER